MLWYSSYLLVDLFCGSLYDAVSRYVLLCNVDGRTDEWGFGNIRNEAVVA
jgi:hypothetical protein